MCLHSHLFFNFQYSRTVLLALSEILNNAYLKLANIPTPSLTAPNIRIGDLIEACQRFSHKSPPWDLLWNSLECTVWYLWSERNRRLKQHTLRPPEVLPREITKETSLSFKSEFQKRLLFTIGDNHDACMEDQPLVATHLVTLSQGDSFFFFFEANHKVIMLYRK